MGYIPPPIALSSEEFNKRIASGAKTLEEIDPEFWKWHKNCIFQHKVQAIILLLGIVVFVIMFLLVL